MPNWIINMAGSWLGLKTLWDKIDGYKTYISGAAQMLTGFAGILGAAAAEANAFVANVHDLAGSFKFLQGLAQNPDAPAKEAVLAWGVVLLGWHTIAAKHAADKAAAAQAVAAPAPAPAQEPAAPPAPPAP